MATIEEKSKRYDEALERAKKELQACGSADCDAARQIFRFFPELKEIGDEDKRIREEIKVILANTDLSQFALDYTFADMIAWLEKQGQQKPKDKYTFNSIPRLLEMIQPTDRAKLYCQKLIDSLEQEGYSTDAKIVRDCLKQMNGEKVAMATMDEQKPTGWSEEDELQMQGIIDLLPGLTIRHNWLKSLKDRVQPQSQWKPSEEMLEALYRVIPENVMEISEDEMLLDKLYQGLKYGRVLSDK